MKKVTAFIGTARKKNTYKAVVQFMQTLQEYGDVETEIVRLSDYHLETCKGCQVCFNRGEAFCPLKDDRDVLFEKIRTSDGVIFATPNYAWDLSGMMKVFLDRFGFAIHRPRYFGKAFTSIVTQAVGRGERITEYFDFTARTLGFNTLKGVVLTAFDTRTETQQRKIERDLAAHCRRFHALLSRPAFPEPTLFQLLMFNVTQNTIRSRGNVANRDHAYFAEKGWLESKYYYPTRINLWKRAAGSVLIKMAPVIQKMID